MPVKAVETSFNGRGTTPSLLGAHHLPSPRWAEAEIAEHSVTFTHVPHCVRLDLPFLDCVVHYFIPKEDLSGSEEMTQ